MSSVNFVNSISLTCSKNTAPEEKIPLTLSTYARQGIVKEVNQEGEPAYLLGKETCYWAIFEKNVFQNGFSGLLIHNNGITQDIPNAKYLKDENQLNFTVKITLKTAYKSLEKFESVCRMTLVAKDGIGDLIKLNGNLFIFNRMRPERIQHAIQSVKKTKNSNEMDFSQLLSTAPAQPSISSETSLQISPSSVSPTSVSNINSTTLEQLTIQRSSETAKKSLQTTAKEFKKKGEQQAAVVALAFAKAFNSFSRSNIDEARAVMSLLTQVGNTFIESLGHTEVIDTTPTIQELEEEQGSIVGVDGKAEESSSERSESDSEKLVPVIKVRKRNNDTSVHPDPSQEVNNNLNNIN